MIKELTKLNDLFTELYGRAIVELLEDADSKAYAGFNFNLGGQAFKFRKSKQTPKKAGQFVVLWKRNEARVSVPFDILDNFDFVIIWSEEKGRSGFFLFPKNKLASQRVLSVKEKEGKRGFRLYPDWVMPPNKLAERTKAWQSPYFIDFDNDRAKNLKAVKSILSEG